MKRGQIDSLPPQEKTTLKKPSLIRVKTHVYFIDHAFQLNF